MTHDHVTGEIIEDDRYELQVGPRYAFRPNRREFVQVVGAGLLIAVPTAKILAQRGARDGGSRGAPAERIQIGTDGSITVFTGKVEVGQGARTHVAQAAAEELHVGVDQIQVVMGDTELCPNDGGTSGSRTTPSTIPRVRAAAAVARETLLDLAAEQLNADRASLEIRDGKIVAANSQATLTIAELAQHAALVSKLKESRDDAALQRAADWRVLGTPAPKIGGNAVVTGAHQYPSDIRRPGMLYGKVLRPPALGATLKSIDLAPAQALAGVIVVRDGEFVGCAAPSSWLARQAVEAIAATAQWDVPESTASHANLSAYLKEHAQTSGGRGRRGGGSSLRGSVAEALESAATKLSASYDIAYIQHAPMEPRAAVAEWSDGKLNVWTATQNPLRVRGELMEAFRLPAERARVIVPDSGGAFGGKHTGETALEAARLAKAAQRPVSLRWTREEEFTWAYFRPGGLIEVTGGLDSGGKLIAWEFANYNSGGSAIQTPYSVANHKVQAVSCEAPLRAGSYRALASTANNFARESFMDELASAASVDPLEFRLQNLPSGRLRDILTAATDEFGWTQRWKNRAPNCGVGLACGTEKASYVAACAEIEIDPQTGAVNVRHVCQAYECGAIQNPANLRAQVEGCLIMGLGGALTEEIQFENGRILNASFSSYTVPRMRDVPELEIILVNRPDLDSVGAGETPIIAVAPAIANAIFHATGTRLRSLPLRVEQLKRA